jgi:hypothetical protein
LKRNIPGPLAVQEFSDGELVAGIRYGQHEIIDFARVLDVRSSHPRAELDDIHANCQLVVDRVTAVAAIEDIDVVTGTAAQLVVPGSPVQ